MLTVKQSIQRFIVRSQIGTKTAAVSAFDRVHRIGSRLKRTLGGKPLHHHPPGRQYILALEIAAHKKITVLLEPRLQFLSIPHQISAVPQFAERLLGCIQTMTDRHDGQIFNNVHALWIAHGSLFQNGRRGNKHVRFGMSLPVRRSRLVLQSSISSKLGQVSLAGYIRNNRGVPLTQLRTFGRYALVYLLEGSGRMKSGNLPLMKCRAGDLLFLYPEIPHGYGPGPQETWSEFYLVFNGPIFDFWRRAGLLQPQTPVQHLPHLRRWLPQLEEVVASNLPDTAKGMLQRVCRLQNFLGNIIEEIQPEAHPLPWLEQAMYKLVETPSTSPAAIARSLGISYETFRKEFTRSTGHPPARYRLHRLMDQARILITERNLSNKQIAETLGFYDEFHFSRRFRQVTGQSTRDFRRGSR